MRADTLLEESHDPAQDFICIHTESILPRLQVPVDHSLLALTATEDCGSLSKPCLVPILILSSIDEPSIDHRLRSTSMECSVDNKTACFQHTNIIPDRILQPFLNHGVMELGSLRSVGLTVFRATETTPHARQNCVYTREYSAAHMTQATCVWL